MENIQNKLNIDFIVSESYFEGELTEFNICEYEGPISYVRATPDPNIFLFLAWDMQDIENQHAEFNWFVIQISKTNLIRFLKDTAPLRECIKGFKSISRVNIRSSISGKLKYITLDNVDALPDNMLSDSYTYEPLINDSKSIQKIKLFLSENI